jgi:hypothetical protein
MDTILRFNRLLKHGSKNLRIAKDAKWQSHRQSLFVLDRNGFLSHQSNVKKILLIYCLVHPPNSICKIYRFSYFWNRNRVSIKSTSNRTGKLHLRAINFLNLALKIKQWFSSQWYDKRAYSWVHRIYSTNEFRFILLLLQFKLKILENEVYF